MASPQPRIGVVTYPGSQDDRDALWALAASDAEAVPVWHEERELPDLDAVVVPGGFSYGDYLRCGAIARFSPVTAAIVEFANAGGLVLGICNGFQILCEAGLLPGALMRNASLRFVCRDVELVVERADTPFTSRCTAARGSSSRSSTATAATCPPADLDPSQVVFRYAEDCNGSVDDIAGVCNERGNVVGLMPHPEHAVDPLLGSADGALIFASLVEAARDRALAALSALETESLRERGMLVQEGSHPCNVPLAERDRSAARNAVRRVGEADEPLALRRLEQLHDRLEPLVARLLRDGQLFYEIRRSPRCRRLGRHEDDAMPGGVTSP